MAESPQSTEELHLGGVQASSVAHQAREAKNHRVETSAPGSLLRQTGTEASTTERASCERKPHAGICAGGAGRPASLPRRAPSEAWCVLQGASPCRVRASHPPVASVASVAESRGASSTNKTDEAYTANRAGRRGIRVPRTMI